MENVVLKARNFRQKLHFLKQGIPLKFALGAPLELSHKEIFLHESAHESPGTQVIEFTLQRRSTTLRLPQQDENLQLVLNARVGRIPAPASLSRLQSLKLYLPYSISCWMLAALLIAVLLCTLLIIPLSRHFSSPSCDISCAKNASIVIESFVALAVLLFVQFGVPPLFCWLRLRSVTTTIVASRLKLETALLIAFAFVNAINSYPNLRNGYFASVILLESSANGQNPVAALKLSIKTKKAINLSSEGG